MSETPDAEARVTDVVSESDNALVLSPALHAAEPVACSAFMQPSPPDQTAAVIVTTTSTPGKRLAQWLDHASELPAQVAVLNLTDRNESSEHAMPANVEVVNLSPSDLTGIGIKISEAFDSFDNDLDIVLCFDSITTILQYVDAQKAFRFFHTLTGRVTDVEATAHYHLDQAACDSQTASTLKQLFDAVIEIDAEATEEVSTWEFRT